MWQAVKVIAVTAAVVLAAAWAARQAGRRLVPHGRGRHLEVLDSLSLGVQRGLFVVRAGRRLLVVGVARDGVALLTEMDPLPAEGLEATVPGGGPTHGPGDVRAGTPSAGRLPFWGDDQLGRRLSRRLAQLRARIGPGRGSEPR